MWVQTEENPFGHTLIVDTFPLGYKYTQSLPFLDTLNFLSSISKPSNRTPWKTQPIGHNTTVGLTMAAAMVQLYQRLKTPRGLWLNRLGETLLLEGAKSELMI